MGNWKTLSILDSTPHLIFMPEVSTVLQINCNSFPVLLVKKRNWLLKSWALICSATRRGNTQTTQEWLFLAHSRGRKMQVLIVWTNDSNSILRGSAHAQRSTNRRCLMSSISFTKLDWRHELSSGN